MKMPRKRRKVIAIDSEKAECSPLITNFYLFKSIDNQGALSKPKPKKDKLKVVQKALVEIDALIINEKKSNVSEIYSAEIASVVGEVREKTQDDRKLEKKCSIVENSMKIGGDQHNKQGAAVNLCDKKQLNEVTLAIDTISIVEKNIPENYCPAECSARNKDETTESDILKQVDPQQAKEALPVLEHSMVEEDSLIGNASAEAYAEAVTVTETETVKENEKEKEKETGTEAISVHNDTKTTVTEVPISIEAPDIIVNNVKTIRKAKHASSYYLSLSEDNQKKEFCGRCKEFEEKHSALSVPLLSRYTYCLL